VLLAGQIVDRKKYRSNPVNYLESMTYKESIRLNPAKILILDNLSAKYCGRRTYAHLHPVSYLESVMRFLPGLKTAGLWLQKPVGEGLSLGPFNFQ